MKYFVIYGYVFPTFVLSRGRMRNVVFLSILSAVLLSVSWPTYGVPFFIFVSLVPLLMMEYQIVNTPELIRKSWKVFGGACLSFTVWNIATTGWLYNSQNPDGSPALMAVVVPVVVNSLLMASIFQLYHWFKKKKSVAMSLVFLVVVWMSFEKFHLEWEFTWAWLNLGNVFANYPELVQWYDTLGATGGSFWILLINTLIFYAWEQWKSKRNRFQLVRFLRVILGIIVIPMFVSLFKFYHFDEKSLGRVKVMMLQPNLDPYTEKYQKDSLQIVKELLDLARASSEKIDYYIAPETSFPGAGGISERGLHHSWSIHLIQNFLQWHPQSIFVGGISTYKIYKSEEEKTETAYHSPTYNFWADNYNSAIQIIPNQEFELYHKGKLVPGVEIFPYMNVLKPILGEVMLNFGGTVASLGIDKERKVFANEYQVGKLAPVICYESVYGEYTTGYVKNGANFLTIMTNDSWWGISEGHRQLLAYARLRAIETRREIARAANSGISAHINAKGQILSQTSYGEKNKLVADIQLYGNETIYVKMGDVLSKICMIFLGLMVIFRIFSLKIGK